MSTVIYKFVPSTLNSVDLLWLFGTMSLCLFIYFIFYKQLGRILIRKQILAANAFIAATIVVSVIFVLSFKERQIEEKYLLNSINAGNFQTVSGVLSGFSNLNDSFEKFKIGKESFTRYLPNKQIPKRGCWADYVIEQRGLSGKKVTMKYIVFPESVQLPPKLGNNKFDQLCVLSFEIN